MHAERTRHIAVEILAYDPAAPRQEETRAGLIAKPGRHVLGDRREFSLARIFRCGPSVVRMCGAGVGI